MLRNFVSSPAAVLAVLGLFSLRVANCQDPPPKPVAAEGQELTRGPIHEAFGEPVQFDPQPGRIVAKAPPAQVEELPPDQKPEGDNVAWIPGYWAWDDEAKDFLWVSGFWRSIPPGRNWVPGYWTKTDDGYQWVSGFWAADAATEVEYLPTPPESLENGPPAEVAADEMWVPGIWMWRDTRYVWRPGYVARVNPDWVWVPAHYEWTPNGFVFVDGYWDYPLVQRGLLFAPATFASIRPGFVYTPSVVLDLRYLVDSLFVGPRFGHYYFGDYYDEHYVKAGFYPWFAFHNSRHGYDPLYAHMRHTMARTDPRWEDHLRTAYYDRREHEAARPPHTYRAYTDWARKAAAERREVQPIARPLREVGTMRDFPTRLQRVPEKQTEVIRNQVKQVQNFRDQRVKIESDGARSIPRPKVTEPKVTDPRPKDKEPKEPVIINRHEPARVKLPDVPHLGPPAGTKVEHRTPLPEAHKLPELQPNMRPPAAGAATHRLPPPEDIIRQHQPKSAPPKKEPPKKGKGG